VYNTGDPLRDMSNFFAGWADTLTFGLTQKIRQSLGYDDVVDKSSGMYGLGQNVGTVHSLIISFGSGGVANAGLRTFLQGLDVVRVGMGVSNGVDKIRSGDTAGGILEIGGSVIGAALSRGVRICNIRPGQQLAAWSVIGVTGGAAVVVGAKGITQILQGEFEGGFSNLLDAGSNLFMMSRLKACFVAGTPILTPDGWKAVEDVAVGERVLSRDENDPTGELRAKRVLATFVRVSPVLNVHVGGKLIGTTGEHPFYVEGKGWIEARLLRIGDLLVSRSGQRIPVDGIVDSGRIELVYNFEVENDHTYFVGKDEWGFDVWVRNAKYNGNIQENASAGRAREVRVAKDLQRKYPGASVQGERYLRDSQGKRAIDPVSEEGRRIDIAVIKNNKAIQGVSSFFRNSPRRQSASSLVLGLTALKFSMTSALISYFGIILVMSISTFAAYGWDKRRSMNGGRRVPENTLQLLAFLGGWPGAIIGQRQFRHKTKKVAIVGSVGYAVLG